MRATWEFVPRVPLVPCFPCVSLCSVWTVRNTKHKSNMKVSACTAFTRGFEICREQRQSVICVYGDHIALTPCRAGGAASIACCFLRSIYGLIGNAAGRFATARLLAAAAIPLLLPMPMLYCHRCRSCCYCRRIRLRRLHKRRPLHYHAFIGIARILLSTSSVDCGRTFVCPHQKGQHQNFRLACGGRPVVFPNVLIFVVTSIQAP